MAQDVTLPALGESVTEGTVTRWLKKVGDTVAVDEPLLEISTDKVDTEIPSPIAGTLTEILVAEDETVAVGAVLARIGGDGTAAAPAAPAAAPAAAKAAAPKVEAPKAEPAKAPAAPAPAASAPAATPQPVAAKPAATKAPSSGAAGYVTPIVRKLAAERGIDLATVTGTGVGGRIRKEDVLAATPSAGVSAKSSTAGTVSELRGTTVPMSRLRKIIAERMVESLHGMAQLTSVVEVDCSRIWALRSKAKDAFEQSEGVKLTFLPFFTRAVADALQEHAGLNASIEGESIVYHGSVNLGIAVDTEKGLIVPTIKNADSKSLADHARDIAELADKARTNKLTPDDLSGGTFTVTNTGSGGTLFDTPIVPSPQVGILATCLITKKAVVIPGPDGGEVISIRPMCYLPLSYDHRIVDGADAARFLQTVKARIEAGAFEAELGL